MSESQTSGGAASTEGSATVDQNTQDTQSVDASATPTEKTVKWEDHKRALDDMHRFKKEMVAERARLAEIQKQNEELRTAKLKEKEDYKTLWESEKKLREEIETRERTLKDNLDLTAKHNAVKDAAMKAGIRPDALKLLDSMNFEGVELEKTSQGRWMVHGADTFVEMFKKEMPFAFQTNTVPKFNSGGANGTVDTGEVTLEKLLAAEREMKKKPNDVVLKNNYRVISQKYMEMRKTK